MKEIFPNYYKKFRCIADKCKHSCCIGWEIDIDSDTMAFYQSLEGPLGDRIRKNIEGEIPHFVLQEGERCPFLAENGLCDIISELGENAICDICRLHPRFSNFYDDFTETGLGLCCEEAVRIVLTDNEKFSLDLPALCEHDGFFKERREVFDILQDREISFLERMKKLSQRYGYLFEFSNYELYDFYMSLERLDARWETELEKLKKASSAEVFEREEMQIFFEQLSCYFVFRHFDEGAEFALLSCYVIGQICSECENFEQMLDVVRMYCSEIEYSEENTEEVASFMF